MKHKSSKKNRKKIYSSEKSNCDNIVEKGKKKKKNEVLIQILIGIGIAAFIPLFTILFNFIASNEKLYDDINHISLGANYKYLQQCFGVPKFKTQYDDMEEYVYFTKKEVIRCFFINNKLEGYFVTKLSNNFFHKIKVPDMYATVISKMDITEKSFSEIRGVPLRIFASAPNGYSREVYLEEYYFGAPGRYHRFYFGCFDYGMETVSDVNFDEKDPEVDYDKYSITDKMFFLNRKNSFPNTYGICDISYADEIFDKVVDCYQYDWD